MKRTHLIALILLAVGGGAILISSATKDTFSDYKCFSETVAQNDENFQVVGIWAKDQGMEYDPEKNPNYFSFWVKDDCGDTRKVIYHDSKPQGFERSEQIVMTGHLEGNDFSAQKILMKCPSKYIDDKVKLRNQPVEGM